MQLAAELVGGMVRLSVRALSPVLRCDKRRLYSIRNGYLVRSKEKHTTYWICLFLTFCTVTTKLLLRSALSLRQKRRNIEDLYWVDVHLRAISRLRKYRARADPDEQIFNEYETIVAEETRHLQKFLADSDGYLDATTS